jgi:putative membrane protein
MLRGLVRSTTAVVLAVLGAACPAAGIVFASQQSAQAAVQPAPASPGPIDALDREFLTVIRFANLWEIPMGQLAVERGTTQAVKDVGATLAEDHTKLDVAIKELAAQFDVTLPDKPSSPTQFWMDEISSKSGKEFDQTFANRLRGAHGTVFGLVAQVRAGTRNDVIRAFAQQANDVVMKHMTILEGTGLVKHTAMFSEAAARTTANPENSLSRGDIVLAAVLGLAMVVATLAFVRTFSARGSVQR